MERHCQKRDEILEDQRGLGHGQGDMERSRKMAGKGEKQAKVSIRQTCD